MLDKCANPACSATFRRLRDGRVFVMEVEGNNQSSGSERARQRQYFWLCNSCRLTMTVISEKGKSARVVPLPATPISARAAS